VLKYYIFLFYLFFISNTFFGQDFVISKNQKLPQNLSSEVSIFEDSSTKLSFEQVKNKPFKKNTANRVLLPFANQATWLKISLKNTTSADSIWHLFIENPLIRKTTLYTENQADSIVFEAFKVRETSKLKRPSFEIKLRQGETKNFYLKLESQRGIYFIIQLFDSESFERFTDSSKMGFGFMSGLTWLVIFIVFTVGFLIIKDSKSRSYAIYSLFRSIGFWSSYNILGSIVSADSLVSEKIAFVFGSISPVISAFLALYILPLDKLPKWIKKALQGTIIINLFLILFLLVDYGSTPLKLLVYFIVASNLFFYSIYGYTLIKKLNEYPYYAIPFLLGNFANLILNLRVTGLINFDYIVELTVLLALLEMLVYVYYLSRIFRISVKNQAEKLINLGYEAEKASKLEELDKLKTRFFTNISHEFRTPLTLLISPIEDLRKKYPQEGIIAVMQRNLQRLQALINQLLDLSKLEAGEMKLNQQEIDLAKFLDQLFASFESLAQDKKIIFNHSQSHLQQFGLFDLDKLEKIINNLLSNAFKFTPQNGRINVRVSPEASVALTPEGGTLLSSNKNDFVVNRVPPSGVRGLGAGLLITIQDYGIGIPPERLPHIFDRFYQVEEHKNYEGTGVGLALVKELVDLLNGTIEVSSELGKGTKFELALPFTPLEKLSDSAIQFERKANFEETLIESKSQINNPIESDGKNIMLIVEDNPDLRNYIASIFENQYQIITAIDGEDGLNKASEHIPDVIISDLMMPKLDGLGLCEKLKTDARTSHIPVVMLTAKASLSDRLIGLEHGADDYLSKPFNREELEIRIHNLIKQRELLRAKYSKISIVVEEEVIEKLPSVEDKFIQKAYEVIENNITNINFDVEQFCDAMAMSRPTMHRKIKALTDQSTTEFIRNYRLQKAANLLKNKTGTVSEIAYQVGFDNLSYFSKSFQDKFGKLPSDWG
jgi:signal transduction histidine kinase/DNA-binding response OmpR family regulator